MNELTTPQFDYQTLDEETRLFVQQKADETHGLLKRTAEHVLRIGQNLRAVREKLPHGQFLPWLAAEFGMSRWTAQHFLQVAEKLEDKWRNFHHLPVSVLYELAAPSTSEEILEQVEQGTLAPTIDAIKEARAAERHAKEAEQQAREQLSSLSEETQEQQRKIEQLTEELAHLQEQLASHSSPRVKIKEVKQFVVPPEARERIERLHKRLKELTEQRDALLQQVASLTEEVRRIAQMYGEGASEQRLRQRWRRLTSEFHTSITKLLSQWPAPLDTLSFEADDWTRLSQTKDLAQRLLNECTALVQARVVESTAEQTDAREG